MIEKSSPGIPSLAATCQADEVMYLTRMSPLSKDARC